MSGVNERLCTNKRYSMGPFHRMGGKGKLGISFVSSPSFTCVQVSEKRREWLRTHSSSRNIEHLCKIKRSVLYCPGPRV